MNVSIVFEKPGIPLERAIKYSINLLLDSIPPAKRLYRVLPVELVEVKKQLDEYHSNGWIRLSTSLYGAPILLLGKRMVP